MSREKLPTQLARRKAKRVNIAFSCDEDMARAIMRVADSMMSGTRSAALRSIVREKIINHPAQHTFTCFPPECSLELWAWAHIKASRLEEPPTFNKCETLVPSADGENVVRIDFVTAA